MVVSLQSSMHFTILRRNPNQEESLIRNRRLLNREPSKWLNWLVKTCKGWGKKTMKKGEERREKREEWRNLHERKINKVAWENRKFHNSPTQQAHSAMKWQWILYILILIHLYINSSGEIKMKKKKKKKISYSLACTIRHKAYQNVGIHLEKSSSGILDILHGTTLGCKDNGKSLALDISLWTTCS